MPPENEDQYEADMDAVTRMYEDAFECIEHEDGEVYRPCQDCEEQDSIANRLDEILSEINDGEPAMEPEPEREPEVQEEVELSLGDIRIDGDKFTVVCGSARERVERALRHAVELWGATGTPLEMEIFVDRTSVRDGKTRSLCRKISVMVDRAMELDEAIRPEELAEDDWVRIWLDENDIPGERTKEKERLEGMSWVHIKVDNAGEPVGRVTACVMPGDTSRHLKVSFAFCRGTVPFSKRQGRIITRDRMDKGLTVTVIQNSGRYETVEEILRRTLHGEKMWNCSEDKATDKFPHWLYPNYREDIPEDVMELLERIYTDVDTKPGLRDEIGPILSRNIKQRADVKLSQITDKKA